MLSLYEPFLVGNEKRYVNDCLESNWISSRGKYVEKFENEFAHYAGAGHAVAVSNGTVAIHVALAALGIGPGDEVIVPTLTYIASVNPIRYVGAIPVFVDSELGSWQMDIHELASKVTSKTRAVIAVHLYGGICDIESLAKFCRERNLYLIEDCAEAIGSRRNGKHVGTFGDIGCFSFFGNKTITTGEGGMVVSNNQTLAEKIAHLKSQGVSSTKYYWHDAIGFNYRMTNIQAAIGLAQLENIGDILQRKRKIAFLYQEEFLKRKLPLTMLGEQDDCINGFWLPVIALDNSSERNMLMRNLKEKYDIETRPAFYPVHTMPMYQDFNRGMYSRAEKLSASGMNLPGYPGLAECDEIRVIDALQAELGERK